MKNDLKNRLFCLERTLSELLMKAIVFKNQNTSEARTGNITISTKIIIDINIFFLAINPKWYRRTIYQIPITEQSNRKLSKCNGALLTNPPL